MADPSANTTISNSQGKKFWKGISDDPSSGVTVVNEKLHLVIPPYYLDDLKKSVTSVIDCRLIRYEKDLGGILAGYGNLTIKNPKADLLFDLSNIHVDVVGDFYIFNPEVKKELTGVVNRKSSDHIGCLVHGLFNISLPKLFSVHSDDWPGKSAHLRDKVRFSITKVDLNSIVPYIEGTIIELIPNVELDSEIRQRTSSDSGVSIASEESMNISTTPEVNMDPKKSKLSLSQKKKASLDSVETNVTATPGKQPKKKATVEYSDPVADEGENIVKEEVKKRKRDISDTAIQETPRNKRARQCDDTASEPVSEDLVPVENLATNLFLKLSEKHDVSTTPSRQQKKKSSENISVQASIATEEPKMVIVPEDVSQRLITEVSSSKTASKKRKIMKIECEIEESVRSPEKIISNPNVDVESDKGNSSEEDHIHFQKIPSSQKNLTKKLDVTSEEKRSVDEDFMISQKTPISQKKPKLTKNTDVKAKLDATPAKKTQSKPVANKLITDSDIESSCSDEDFVISQKTPVSQTKPKLTKKTEVKAKFDATPAKKTPSKHVTKKLNTESDKESSYSDEDFMISQKTPVSQTNNILTKRTDLKAKLDATPAKKTPSKPVAKKLITDSDKESSCSDEDFMISQKTPVSQTKPKLTKKTDVKSKFDATPAKKTPSKHVAKKLNTDSDKESSCSDNFESSQKTFLTQKKLAKKADVVVSTPAKKTPSKHAKEEASHKISKSYVETNDTVTPRTQPKKKAAIEDSDPENEQETLIQELLNRSHFATPSNSTPTAKKSIQKKTPLSKIKQNGSEKKSKTPLESQISMQVRENKTATPNKKNSKESLSGKSLKALASYEKQESAEIGQEVLSLKKTPKTPSSKISLSASNVSLTEKKNKAESTKKRTRLQKDADEEVNFDKEFILSEMLKSVQPKEKRSKSKTSRLLNSDH